MAALTDSVRRECTPSRRWPSGCSTLGGPICPVERSSTLRREFWSGRFPGRFEVYPCLVAFEDGTYFWSRQVMQSIIRNRQFYVRRLDRLIAELEAVRGSDDPKTTLTHHAEHFAR